jgi:hypothetical protein
MPEPQPADSRPLKKPTPLEVLTTKQESLNRFFWSSELAYQLCIQRLLTDSTPDTHVIEAFSKTDTFPKLKASALLQPNNKLHLAHYDQTLDQFRCQLKWNLEETSRYVIIAFHGDLEHFMDERIKSANARKSEKSLKPKELKNLLKLGYPKLIAKLEDQCLLRHTIKPEISLKAQGYRLLRHKLTHSESHELDDFSYEAVLQDRVHKDERFNDLNVSA